MELLPGGAQSPSEDQLVAAIRRATLEGSLTRCCAGGTVVQAQGRRSPCSIDRGLPAQPRSTIPACRARRWAGRGTVGSGTPNPGGSSSPRGFKIMYGPAPRQPKLTYIRVYRAPWSRQHRVTLHQGPPERIGQIYQMHANKREERRSRCRASRSRCDGMKGTPPRATR